MRQSVKIDNSFPNDNGSFFAVRKTLPKLQKMQCFHVFLEHKCHLFKYNSFIIFEAFGKNYSPVLYQYETSNINNFLSQIQFKSSLHKIESDTKFAQFQKIKSILMD